LMVFSLIGYVKIDLLMVDLRFIPKLFVFYKIIGT
jgi:hypothetical protein